MKWHRSDDVRRLDVAKTVFILDPKNCHVWHTTNIDPALAGVNPNDPNFDPTLYTGEVVEMDQYGNVLNYWQFAQNAIESLACDGHPLRWPLSFLAPRFSRHCV